MKKSSLEILVIGKPHIRLLIAILSGLAILGMPKVSQAAVTNLTLEDKTVNPGTTVAIKVSWTSTSTTLLNYLNTMFILTAVGPAPTGEVTFTNTPGTPTPPGNPAFGNPAFAPINDPTYVFYNDSSDFINGPTSNPASVTTTNWDYDTYNIADSTNSGFDVTPSTGTDLWTILNLTVSSLAGGQYQITLGSSDYSNIALSTGANVSLTNADISGGLITVNSVPEPSGNLALLALCSIGLLTRRRRAA